MNSEIIDKIVKGLDEEVEKIKEALLNGEPLTGVNGIDTEEDEDPAEEITQ